jgi:quercetin dioxygenase-like cupin family protein
MMAQRASPLQHDAGTRGVVSSQTGTVPPVVPEARLEDVGSGLAPVTPGWFVVNVSDAAWLRNAAFGARCVFQSDVPVLRNRPDVEVQRFPQLGITLAVLEPGRPSGLYHAEDVQEDFLVLAGSCTALVGGDERTLRQWDFLHCPPGTAHVFRGAGVRPCVILMLGARPEGRSIVYPRSARALAWGAGAEAETGSPAEAYAPFPHWRPGRPEDEAELPWAR